MQPEIEVKFLNVDKEAIRHKIKNVGGQLVKSERLMRRKTFDFVNLELPAGQYKWMRIRDEGDKITMNIKHLIDKDAVDGVNELELIVDDFDNACKMLVEIGLVETNYQENYRETWQLDDCEITIDTWPGLNPFIELEGSSEIMVRETATKLGFDFGDSVMGSVDFVYQKLLDIPLNALADIKELTFANFKTQLKQYL